MIGDAVFAVALLVAIVLYFPSRPNTPPSISSSLPRTDFKDGLLKLVRNKNAWFCMIGYALPGGVIGAWSAVMTINFKPLGIDDAESGRIGVIAVFVNAVVALSFGYITDRIRKHIKSTLVILISLAALSFLWVLLLCERIIPFSHWQLYASVIAGTSFNFACVPLFFEYTVELAYPVTEGLVGGYMTVFNNAVGFVFLCVFFVKDISYVWINYVILFSTVLALPMLLLSQESYRRMDVDENEEVVPEEERNLPENIEEEGEEHQEQGRA